MTYSSPSCAFKTRVESLPFKFGRVSASYSTDPSLSSLLAQETVNSIKPNPQRTYATKPVSRPKAHTGRTTSSPRKNAKATTTVTTVVIDGVDAEGSTSTGNRAKRTGLTKSKAKAGPTAKPKAKPKAKTKAKAKAKPKTKPKIKPKIKPKTRAGALGKPRAKKALTKEQQDKKQIRDLKTTALKPPKRHPSSAYHVLVAEVAKESHIMNSRAASIKYKELLPEELEV